MLVLACGGRAKSDDPPAPTATGLQVLVEGEKDPVHVAVDERFVYWASPAEVRRAPLEGGAAVILATGSGINSLAVAEEYVYFAASEYVPGQSAERGFIRRVPRFGGDSETIAQMQHPMSVVVGGGRLYWSSADLVETGSEGSLWSAALDGTDARALATGLPPTSTLLADDSSLCVGSLVTLALQGIYDISQLVEQYRTLPAVVGVDGIRSDANDAGPELCAHRSGEHYEYVVDRTSGECPGRCEHDAHRFASDAPGQLTALGVWDSRSSELTPDWFDYRCPLSAGAPGER